MEESKRYSKWLIDKYPEAKIFNVDNFSLKQLEMLNFLLSRKYSLDDIVKYKMHDYKFSQIAKYYYYKSNNFDDIFIDYVMTIKVREDIRSELLKLKEYYESADLINFIELGYSFGQLKQIRIGRDNNVDVEKYVDIKNSWSAMKKIRLDLIDSGVDDGS